MAFKKMEDASRDHYNSQLRAVSIGVAKTQNQQALERKALDAKLHNEEVTRDAADLTYFNKSTMNPSATLSASMA